MNLTDSQKIDLLLEKMLSMENHMQSMEDRMQSIENRMQSMEDRMQSMEDRMQNLEEITAEVKMILENEIRVNIQRVAEGHFDLSRHLQEAMRPNNEVEMLAIKVRMLESDVKELKRRMA
ncbi:MAG: hypothetical protein LUE63_05095 [Lachnospiraceae bacterium]|nr:hypothetical protein [Lachnospiraceae bacterium]